MVDLGNGVKVYWDMMKEVKVVVDPSMKGQVCGLCGNFDGDKKNDTTLGPHILANYEGAVYKPCEALMKKGSFGQLVRN